MRRGWKNLKRPAFIFAGLLVAVGAGSLFLLYSPSEQPKPAYDAANPQLNKAYWESRVRALGGSAAYAEFLDKAKAGPPGRQHLAAHQMGGLLYDLLGREGVSVCDSSFGFGCFHGLFAHLIAEEGTEAAASLAVACKDAPSMFYGPCEHGIGHAVFDYFGPERIDDALAFCAAHTRDMPISGCIAGVFMENDYGVTNLADTPSAVRPPDPANPYGPCSRVAPHYQNSCYFSLGHRIGDSSKDPTLCTKLGDVHGAICSLGIAATRSATPFEGAEVTRKVCVLMPEDERGGCPPI